MDDILDIIRGSNIGWLFIVVYLILLSLKRAYLAVAEALRHVVSSFIGGDASR